MNFFEVLTWKNSNFLKQLKGTFPTIQNANVVSIPANKASEWKLLNALNTKTNNTKGETNESYNRISQRLLDRT